jgi:hypothetical protein
VGIISSTGIKATINLTVNKGLESALGKHKMLRKVKACFTVCRYGHKIILMFINNFVKVT